MGEKRSYEWFEKRHKSKGLELAHEQISKAFDTVAWLNKAAKSFTERNFPQTKEYIEKLYTAEEEVDKLRELVFKELSTGTALMADYREDLMHVVKRLDTLADHTKDAARCLEMLGEVEIPKELNEKTLFMTSKLMECAQALNRGIEKISSDSAGALMQAKMVAGLEHELDDEYLKTKSLFVKYGDKINAGAMVIYDDLVEFIEQAADMCADTADYISVLSSTE
jgi:predicted phosphate transport protein (TIGR00153 family)